MQKLFLFLLIISALFLRIQQLDRPIWVDEAAYGILINDTQEFRSFVPLLISKIQAPDNVQQLRHPFILLSVLSVLAVWFVVKDKRNALMVVAVLAFAPIYVYWGTMARPYTIALFFVILGWRYPAFYILAIFTTPYAMAGLNLWRIKERWLYYLFLLFLSFVYYYSLDLSSFSHFNMRFLLNAKRLWIIPLCSLMLHCADFDLERSSGLFKFIKRLGKQEV